MALPFEMASTIKDDKYFNILHWKHMVGSMHGEPQADPSVMMEIMFS
jgi:hypothetical protein